MISLFARASEHTRYDPETGVTESSPVMDDHELWRAIKDVDAAVKAPRRGITPAELEQVARIYRENIAGSPVEEVRASLGYSSARTAARRVQQARDAGLLPPTTPGKRKA